MFKKVADVTGTYDFDIEDCRELNYEIGLDDFFRISERGGGWGAELVINIGVNILATLSVEVLVCIIKAVFNKAKQKSQNLQDNKEEEFVNITINCENYDCNNTNMSFTINMFNDDDTIMNSVKKIKSVAKKIDTEE